MPPHAGASANAIEVVDEQVLVTKVDEIKIPLAVVKEHLLKQGVMQQLHDFCEQCSVNPQDCVDLRKAIQQLMDEGVLQVEQISPKEDVCVLEIANSTSHNNQGLDQVQVDLREI